MSLGFSFTYFGNNFQTVTVNTNGYALFSSQTTCCSLALPAISNSISGLNYDLKTTSSVGTSGIFYRSLTQALNANGLASIKSSINRLVPSFVPTNGFQLVWNNVSSLSGGLTATFSIDLASDSSSSYVVINYSSCLNGAPLKSTPGLYYINTNGVLQVLQITNPCSSSNVNLPGTWVFVVTSIGKVTIFHFKN